MTISINCAADQQTAYIALASNPHFITFVVQEMDSSVDKFITECAEEINNAQWMKVVADENDMTVAEAKDFTACMNTEGAAETAAVVLAAAKYIANS